jgi:hypothetical protein
LTLRLSITNNLDLLIFIILILTVYNCKDRPKEKISYQKIYSKNQQYLFNLLDNYKAAYYSAKQQELKDTIRSIYLEKLRYFLVDSLGRHIDSINVSVDTVIQKGWLVTTQFHTRDIEFKYGMIFKDSMNTKWDSLYRWMRSLKRDSNLTVDFVHLGSGELNLPDDKSKPTIKIFAYPKPITAKPK